MAELLNCNSGNYQCGAICIPDSKACTKGLTGQEASTLAELDMLVALANKHSISKLEAGRVASAVEAFLKGTTEGAKKKAGDNLQDPAVAKQYAEFYAAGKDKTYKPKADTSINTVKAVLAELKASMPAKDFAKLKSALGSKGTPTKAQLAEAGWKGTNERAEAVLKSLLDNEFTDVLGNFTNWRTGLQLDHRLAGSMGGKDTPDNWLWISSATNQQKGAVEASVKKSGLTSPAEQEEFVRQGLIGLLERNAAMSADEVASIKAKGSAEVQATAGRIGAIRDNFPLMSKELRLAKIAEAKATGLKDLFKGLVAKGQSYRFVPETGGRGRTTYPKASQAKALLIANQGGEPDLQELKGIVDKMVANGNYTAETAIAKMFASFPPKDKAIIAKLQRLFS